MTQQKMKIKENINHLRMNGFRKPDTLTNWRRNRPSLFHLERRFIKKNVCNDFKMDERA